mmetsp:Transcript_5834/g.9971  ORF Transcript_5834/g.9971 Transcript_5834/m.9971 type:complete len:147 (-) Transcript_5834:506-946(-)
MGIFKTETGNIYLVNGEEAAFFGCDATSCPLQPNSIMEKLHSGAQEFWSEMFEVKFERVDGVPEGLTSKVPVISVTDEFIRDYAKFKFTLRAILFTHFVVSKSEGHLYSDMIIELAEQGDFQKIEYLLTELCNSSREDNRFIRQVL